MKKLLLTTLMTIAATPAMSAGYFDRPYAQIGLGVASSNSNSYWNHDGQVITDKVKPTH
jgi:hypothetical protein